MVTGVTKRRRGARRKGTSFVSASADTLPKREGLEGRKVYDVWTQPTVADVYAQLKVAEQMLSRCTDPALAVVRRKMYDLEDTMWQFISE